MCDNDVRPPCRRCGEVKSNSGYCGCFVPKTGMVLTTAQLARELDVSEFDINIAVHDRMIEPSSFSETSGYGFCEESVSKARFYFEEKRKAGAMNMNYRIDHCAIIGKSCSSCPGERTCDKTLRLGLPTEDGYYEDPKDDSQLIFSGGEWFMWDDNGECFSGVFAPKGDEMRTVKLITPGTFDPDASCPGNLSEVE